MTTNVYDGNAGIVATDSRWSVKYGNYLIYLDDVGYEKLEQVLDRVFMFAGDGRRIQEWKDWIRSNPVDASGMPEFKGMAVCMVNIETNAVEFHVHQDITSEGAFFAGSGAMHAYQCWAKNRDAHRSVESAKITDFFSGGEVKFFNCVTKLHNLGTNLPAAAVTIDMVNRAISTRGLVMKMNTTTNPSLPFAKAANDIPELREAQGKLESGELSASSPCDGMYNDWSEDDKAKFKNAIGNMFGWKK